MNSPRTDPPPIPSRVFHFIRLHLLTMWWVLAFAVVRRQWALIPVIVLLLLTGLLIFATSNPAVSVFIYPLF